MAGKRTIKLHVEQDILKDYEGGMRSSEISARHGVNRKTVTLIVRRNGGVVRDQRAASGRPLVSPESYKEQVMELREKGLSQTAIAKEIGMSQTVVSRTLRALGIPTKKSMAGESGSNWRGGRTVTGHGYVAVYVSENDPMASMRSKAGYVLEHRLVMARSLGRPLQFFESVHHINGNRKDNRLNNLQLRQGKHGKGWKLMCACCESTNIIGVELD